MAKSTIESLVPLPSKNTADKTAGRTRKMSPEESEELAGHGVVDLETGDQVLLPPQEEFSTWNDAIKKASGSDKEDLETMQTYYKEERLSKGWKVVKITFHDDPDPDEGGFKVLLTNARGDYQTMSCSDDKVYLSSNEDLGDRN
ncbi:MAG: hypothetical protein ABH833_03030 [Parcubacteria group bacterium]